MRRLGLLGWSVMLAGAILIAPAGGAGAAVTVGIPDRCATPGWWCRATL